MKIAVTYENGEVFQHFGHTQAFKFYDCRDGRVESSRVEDTGGSGHEALALYLKDRGVEALICGGIGAGAQRALAAAGIALYAGVTGDADRAVEELLAGTLQYSAAANCSHHGEHHGEHHHGEGGCGGHCHES